MDYGINEHRNHGLNTLETGSGAGFGLSEREEGKNGLQNPKNVQEVSKHGFLMKFPIVITC